MLGKIHSAQLTDYCLLIVVVLGGRASRESQHQPGLLPLWPALSHGPRICLPAGEKLLQPGGMMLITSQNCSSVSLNWLLCSETISKTLEWKRFCFSSRCQLNVFRCQHWSACVWSSCESCAVTSTTSTWASSSAAPPQPPPRQVRPSRHRSASLRRFCIQKCFLSGIQWREHF